MSKMKSNSKKKFFLCFRPVVDVDFVFEPNEGDDQMNTKTKKKKKNRGLIEKSSSSSDANKETRNFSQIVKAVLFETILAKRIRKRKSLKRSVSADDEFEGSPIFSSSSSISSTTSSSCSSSNSEINLSPTVRNDTKQQEEVQHKAGKSCRSSLNGGILSLLMIILGLTVLCGKFYGIVLTTIWVYFVVPSCRRKDSEEIKTENREILSRAEYIKKVKKVGSKDRSRGNCFSCLMPSESMQFDGRNYNNNNTSNRLLVN